MAPSYTLIGSPFSTFTRSIALGLIYKDVAFDQVNVAPHSDVACVHHPFGFLPSLVIRGVEIEQNGEVQQVDIKLRESQAIVRYIDRVRPEPTLHLGDGRAIGHATIPEQLWEFVNFTTSYGFPAIEKGIIKPRLEATDEGLAEAQILARVAPGLSALRCFLETAEAHMAPEGYVFGDALTWADLFLYPLLADLSTIPERELLSPRLRAWITKVEALEAVRITRNGTLATGARFPAA